MIIGWQKAAKKVWTAGLYLSRISIILTIVWAIAFNFHADFDTYFRSGKLARVWVFLWIYDWPRGDKKLLADRLYNFSDISWAFLFIRCSDKNEFWKDLLTNDCILTSKNTVNKFSELISKDFSLPQYGSIRIYIFWVYLTSLSLEVQIARLPMTTSGICRRFIWERAHRYWRSDSYGKLDLLA